jgi:hypothetical protein
LLEVRDPKKKRKKNKKNVGLLDLDYSQIWLNPSIRMTGIWQHKTNSLKKKHLT